MYLTSLKNSIAKNKNTQNDYFKKNNTKIAFVHIPKCAGTSITQFITETFSDVEHIQYKAGGLMAENIKNKPNILRDKNFISGHFYIDELPDYKNYKLITLLRHPIERIISEYNFLVKCKSIDRQEMSIDKWMETVINVAPDNFMSTMIAGKEGADDPFDFLLSHYAAFGVQDGMNLFEHQIASLLGISTKKMLTRNITKIKSDSNSIRDISLKNLKIFIEKNKTDFDLYEKTRHHVRKG